MQGAPPTQVEERGRMGVTKERPVGGPSCPKVCNLEAIGRQCFHHDLMAFLQDSSYSGQEDRSMSEFCKELLLIYHGDKHRS